MGNRPRDAADVKRQRVPPHNLQAEAALLGAMMLSVDAVADVEGLVQSGHFYRPSHGGVFDAILSVSREGGNADAIVVLERLDQHHSDTLGGLDGLLMMMQDTPATSNAPRYAETVRECAMRRSLLSACQEVITEAYEGPCDSAAVLDRAREQFLARDTSPAQIDAVPLYDSLSKALTTLEDINEGRGPRRAPTGFPELDEFLSGGLVPSGFYVLGARPAMGKSALAAEIALNIASSSGPVLLVTLEMPDEDIAMRLMASRGRIDSRRMLNKAKTIKEWDQIHRAVVELKDAPLFLMSHSGATVTDVRRAARQVRANEGSLRLVVVDYLQLMGSVGSLGRRERPETRQLEIAEITRSLKVMAGEMGCAVLAVSQLNRGVEARTDKRPSLSDLRESGAIEQDADVVMLLYRDEFYKPGDAKTEGLAEVNIAKNRNGPSGRVELGFISRFTAFVPLGSGPRAKAQTF